MKKEIVMTLMMLMPLSIAFAEQQPAGHPHDGRVKIVNFDENNVVAFKGTPLTSTQLLFGLDEVVLNIDSGDKMVWSVKTNARTPNMVFLKPTKFGLNTNITVVTNKHNYYFHATSSSESTSARDQTYTIKFRYPEEERARLHAINEEKRQQAALNHFKAPEVRNSDYRFSGNKQIMPAHVFDDGTFTYFELRKNQPAPAIFAIDNKQGKESIVNTRREGNYLVVQRLAPQFTLRNGDIVASVFNSREIMNIKQNRG